MAVTQEVVVGNLTAVDNTQVAFNSVQKNAKKTAAASKHLNQQFRFLRGGAGQMGHQIQDVAVQLQMGTNAMVVLGQQGGQIASLFGPKGALVGAFISVAAAVGMSLAPRLLGVTRNFEDLEDKIKSTATAFGELTEKQRQALIAQEKLEKIKLAQEQLELKKELNETNATLDVYQKRLDAANARLKRSRGNNRAAAATVDSLTKKIETLTLEQALYEGALETTTRQQELSEEAIQALIGGNDDLSKSLKNAEGMTDALRKAEAKRFEQLLAAEDKLLGIGGSEDERVQNKLTALEKSLVTEIEAIRIAEEQKRQVVQEALDRGLIDWQKAQDIRAQIAQASSEAIQKSMLMSMQTVVSSTSQQVNQLAGFFDEASAIGKAFFVVSQALAAADAVIKGFQTAAAIRVAYANMAAMAGPGAPAILAAGEAHAAMAVGIGVATAAAIAGQTLASFEGGGMIPNGPRAGGIDGRGGRMAIVHPNEKITDLNRGEGAKSVNINFNIQANDARGFDELLMQRRGMIVSMVNKAVNNRGRRSLT